MRICHSKDEWPVTQRLDLLRRHTLVLIGEEFPKPRKLIVANRIQTVISVLYYLPILNIHPIHLPPEFYHAFRIEGPELSF